MLNFEYINVFFLIIPILIILFLLYRQYKIGYKVSFYDDLKKVYGASNKKYFVNLILLFLISFLYILILAKPVDKITNETIEKNGVDIILALDVSYSMTAADLKPNRLEVAKNVIRGFISKLETDRLGIVIFSGKPFTSTPLTFDYDLLDDIVSKIDIGIINQGIYQLQGTSIGDALLLATKNFGDSEREKVIVLLTDGEANRGINPIEALKYLKEKGVKVYSVGIGGKENTYVEMGGQKLVVGGIDEDTLKTIANSTSGEFFIADSEDKFIEIFDKISKLEKKDIEVKSITVNKEKYHLYLYILILLFFVYILFKKID